MTSLAHADCHAAPYQFFPDRNDHVTVQVTAESASYCAMQFHEGGASYHITGASLDKAPLHGVVTQTGPMAFLYRSSEHYRGRDSYSIKLCADVGGRHGCSTLTYDVEVQ